MCIKECIIVALVMILLVGCGNDGGNHIYERPIGGDPELRRQMMKEIFKGEMIANAREIATILITYGLEFDDYKKLDGVDFYKKQDYDSMLRFVNCLALPSDEEHATYKNIGALSEDKAYVYVEEAQVKQMLHEVFNVNDIPENFAPYYDAEKKAYQFENKELDKKVSKMEIVKMDVSEEKVLQTCKLTSLDQSEELTLTIEYSNYWDSVAFTRLKSITISQDNT